MKVKHTIVIFALGYCLDFMGGLCRLLHYPGAGLLMITGTLCKVAGILLFLYKLFTNQQLKKFLNS